MTISEAIRKTLRETAAGPVVGIKYRFYSEVWFIPCGPFRSISEAEKAGYSAELQPDTNSEVYSKWERSK